MQIFGAQNLAGMASQRLGVTLDPAIIVSVERMLQDPTKTQKLAAVAKSVTPQQVAEVAKLIQAPILGLLASNVDAATVENLKQQGLALMDTFVAPQPAAPAA
ncbi:hypothetical protein HK102_001239 [Quaeritorhiza haematococci]|nr:hypothetical protein HK102_001239 [Quaeritorhiza haematococci]